ncbi:MAG: sugar phosphate isomerase/epimerase [Pirellulales bacterium]|nr:sugar phosphate isomerase/epimerase [Pirellulales bacterium]
MALLRRREFLRTAGAVSLGAGLLGRSPLPCSAEEAVKEAAKGAPNAEKLGWRLGVNTYTFRLFTLFEALDKIASLGLKYAEFSPGARFGKDDATVVGETMPPAARKTLKKKAADLGIKLITYSGSDVFRDAESSKRTFEFAKEMGAENLYFEAPAEKLDLLDKLCGEYEINVAIHNHPKPALYWSPDKVLEAVAGRSKRIGALCDTGHWKRSGLNPVECLKKLEGRIVCFHFKDLIREGGGYHDVPWGTGVCDVAGMLAEIHRQGVKAPFSFEYEYHWENSLPEIARSVVYFEKIAAELLAQAKS